MECIRCGTELKDNSTVQCPVCRLRQDRDSLKPVEMAFLCDVPGTGRFVELNRRNSYILGREDSADILLPNPIVSRAHAKIMWENGQFHVLDLEAANGTFVNGVRIRRGPLADGDIIRIGPFDMKYVTGEPREKKWGDAETWDIKPEQVLDLESKGARPWLAEAGQTDDSLMGMLRDDAEGKSLQELVSRLRKLALLDGLTGLPNRRYLERTLHARVDRMHRYDEPFGILFIDIDDFKQVNDLHGHETGDRVLQEVAATLARSTRSFDVVGRWGGEEFVAVIANVAGDELRQIAEKFRALVEKVEVSSGMGRVHVTISIGAALAGPDDTEETLLKKVDRLMYKSKAQGKNRTTVFMRRPGIAETKRDTNK
jgi:diguanylate cyclase (GGDEF)-like protein